MPRKICPFGASKIIIKMSPSALQILSAGAEFAVRGLHSVLPLPSVQCAEYWRGFVCRILAMFAQQGAATGVSGSRALFILRPLSEHFFCFWLMSIPFSPTLKIFLPEEQTRACVCSRGAAAAGVVTRTEARLVEAGPWRLMTSGPRPRCVNISGDRGFTAWYPVLYPLIPA